MYAKARFEVKLVPEHSRVSCCNAYMCCGNGFTLKFTSRISPLGIRNTQDLLTAALDRYLLDVSSSHYMSQDVSCVQEDEEQLGHSNSLLI